MSDHTDWQRDEKVIAMARDLKHKPSRKRRLTEIEMADEPVKKK